MPHHTRTRSGQHTVPTDKYDSKHGDVLRYLMSAYFELGSIPGRVFMSWSLHVTELRFISGIITVDVQGQLD